MPTTFPITFSTDGMFPVPFTGDEQDFANAILAHLQASISSNNLLLGKIGGTEPVTDVGPWLDVNSGNIWKIWGGAAYKPTTAQIKQGSHFLTLSTETLTADRAPKFQDKDGVVAMTSDVYTGRGTKILTGTTPTLDWSTNFSFYQAISANITPIFTNSLPGQRIRVCIVATGAHTYTWPASVKWAGGTALNTITTDGVDLFEFYNLVGTIYGKRVGANFS